MSERLQLPAPGPQRDALVAEKILRWVWVRPGKQRFLINPESAERVPSGFTPSGPHGFLKLWSTQNWAAIEFCEWTSQERGWLWECKQVRPHRWMVNVEHQPNHTVWCAQPQPLAAAITEAALRADEEERR